MASIREVEWSRSVIAVGDGRGFVVWGASGPLIITAAHCLPFIPPPHLGRHLEETFLNLLGPLGKNKPMVAARCLFADPISDIAVLGRPDDQELSHHANKYDELSANTSALSVAALAEDAMGVGRAEGAWVLTLNGKWTMCEVTVRGHVL